MTSALEKLFKECSQTNLPPVHLWNPEHCGDIGMQIAEDGTWYYQGTPIKRQPMVKLFSTILRREPDNSYVLVTPVEKIVIEVEDVPFIAVEYSIQDINKTREILVKTNVGDVVKIDDKHPLSFKIDENNGGVKPYIEIRNGLLARLTRSMTYDLLEQVEQKEENNDITLGFWSCGSFFPLIQMSEIT